MKKIAANSRNSRQIMYSVYRERKPWKNPSRILSRITIEHSDFTLPISPPRIKSDTFYKLESTVTGKRRPRKLWSSDQVRRLISNK